MSRRRHQRKSKPESIAPVVDGASELVGSAQSPIQRREVALLIVIVLAGADLRLYALSHSAVEHFDEGVYASNVYFGAPDYAYPQQQFYAPPLLPALIEAGMITGLPPNVAALLPSFLVGCGTIVALWWFGRSWFSPAVGLGAAVLAALSDFHIAYSATALTDVLLGLWLVLAVDAMARSLLKGDYRWAIGAGIYTGLAWWTKYNGWLPLAIEAAALPLLWLQIRPPRQQFIRWLGCFAVTAFTAAAIWSPYLFSLQSQGGYGAIAANHAKYVVGFSRWLDSAGRQISAQYVMDGLTSWLAVAVAWAIAVILLQQGEVGQPKASHRIYGARAIPFVYGVILVAICFAATTLVVSATSSALGLQHSLRAGLQTRTRDVRRAIGLSVLAAWWVGLGVATPCYWPYPRLMLPWLLACFLGAALGLELIASSLIGSRASLTEAKELGRSKRLLPGLLPAMVALMAVFTTRSALPPLRHVGGLHDNRLGVMILAESVRDSLATERNERLSNNVSRAVYVYGEPALFFQLKAAGEPFVGPVQEIPGEAAQSQGRDVPTYLVVGPHARRDPQFQSAWPKAESRWELVASFDYQPSAIVWLDLFDPRKVEPGELPGEKVEVYRLR